MFKNIACVSFLLILFCGQQMEGQTITEKITSSYSGNGVANINTHHSGTIENQMAETEWEKISHLKITGPVNSGDISYIKEKCLSTIEIMDLSNAEFYDLDAYAFHEFKRLRMIVLPDGLENIAPFAFANCKNLSTVTLPNSITNIGESAFEHCTSLENINLPDKLTAIGEKAFKDTKISELKFPTHGLKIGEEAFYGCLFQHINIKNATEIGDYAFQNCINLEQVEIAGDLTKIQEGTFSGCISLNEINLPGTISQLSAGALSECKNLKKILIYSSKPPVIGNEALPVDLKLTIYVKSDSYSAYKAHKTWGTYKLKNIKK